MIKTQAKPVVVSPESTVEVAKVESVNAIEVVKEANVEVGDRKSVV